jgi:hypothetical protein
LKFCREIPNLVKIVEKYQALYVGTQVHSISLVGGVSSPSKRSVRMELYQALVIAEEV